MKPGICHSIRVVPAAFLIFILIACNRHETEPAAPFDASQLEYYPLFIGKYRIYRVDSVVYDPVQLHLAVQDSSVTYVRERVTDTIRNNTGALVYLVEHSEKKDLSSAWEVKFIAGAERNTGQAVRIENNLRFLPLIFPFDIRSAWNGNLWIDPGREIEVAGERMMPFANWAYEVDSLDIPQQIGTFAFDSTLVVTEASEENAYEKRFSRVWYAKHVGLVRREQWILDSQYCNQTPAPADCETRPWELKADRGYILKQTILEFN